VHGDAAHGVVHQCKAAGARGTASVGSNWAGTNWGHCDGGPDESIDGGIISEDAEECLITTTAWLGSALLEGVESGEPVCWGSDDRRGRSGWESRWGREEGHEIVCDEVPVCVGDGELAWASGGGIDDSGNVDVECGETLCTGNEKAVSREDLDQGKRVVGPDETVFSLESNGNSSHAGIGVRALLVLLESDLSRHVVRWRSR
jgi:hypothetical protein